MPPQLRGSQVTEELLRITTDRSGSNDEESPNPKRPRYFKITPDQLSQILVACSVTLQSQGGSPTGILPQASAAPSYVTNAKYKDISCCPIKPIYEGNCRTIFDFHQESSKNDIS